MREDIRIIRPGLGLHPRYFENLVGSKLLKDISYGEPIDLTFIDDKDFPKVSKSDDFTLKKVIPTSEQINFLYDLLRMRKFGISHNVMPTLEQHASFVRNHPYRGWWLIHDPTNTLNVIGSVYASFDNSIGIDIDLNKISFTAEFFTQKLKKEISPLAPESSKIFGDFFYNVSPKNNDLITWLSDSGYYTSQISLSPK